MTFVVILCKVRREQKRKETTQLQFIKYFLKYKERKSRYTNVEHLFISVGKVPLVHRIHTTFI